MCSHGMDCMILQTVAVLHTHRFIDRHSSAVRPKQLIESDAQILADHLHTNLMRVVPQLPSNVRSTATFDMCHAF